MAGYQYPTGAEHWARFHGIKASARSWLGRRVLSLYLQAAGHDVLGLDLDDPTAGWYGKIFELFGVRRVIWRIMPFVPLPDLGAKFDYVTGFMICFNDHQSENPWKLEQWRFFLDDLATRLKPGAIVWFELNPAADGSHYTPELKTFFESRGIIVDGKRLVWGLDEMHYRVLLRLAQLEGLGDAEGGRGGADRGGFCGGAEGLKVGF